MRYTVLTLFLVLCLVALSAASPAKKQGPACSANCGDAYEPICAKAANGSKERLLTFGSACVMGNYNCQHADDPFVEKAKGECGGNVSVRLS